MGMNTPLLGTDAGRLPNRLVRAGLFCAFLAVSFAASAQRLRSTTVLVNGQKGLNSTTAPKFGPGKRKPDTPCKDGCGFRAKHWEKTPP